MQLGDGKEEHITVPTILKRLDYSGLVAQRSTGTCRMRHGTASDFRFGGKAGHSSEEAEQCHMKMNLNLRPERHKTPP